MSAPEDSLLKDEEFLRRIFDAVPAALFIVDPEVRVLHFNRMAAQLLQDKESVFNKRGGDALHCINSNPGGCGRSDACSTCVIRDAVVESVHGGNVHREKTAIDIMRGEEITRVHLLVTASPFKYADRIFSLLILEDISELIQLRNLVPICAWCKKIRNDHDYWLSVEEYLGTQLDVAFTHGICNECMERVFEADDSQE